MSPELRLYLSNDMGRMLMMEREGKEAVWSEDEESNRGRMKRRNQGRY